MKEFISFLFDVGNVSTTATVIIALLSLTVTKFKTEYGIISTIVSSSMMLMLLIRDPVLVTVNQWMGYEAYKSLAIASWYMFWSTMQLLTIYSCRYACLINHIPRTNTYMLFALAFCVLTLIQILGAIDHLYIQSSVIDSVYRYAVVALDTVVAMMLFTEFLRVPLFDRRPYFQRAVSSVLSAVRSRNKG